MLPLDLATQQTYEFVRRSLPGNGLRLLEVGCGRGELVLKLSQEGHEIIGVELSREHVRSARSRGLDVRHADFLSFDDKPFDAILFTRSLHHIPRLNDAVERACALLKPGGLLLAEEFDLEHIDRPTTAWFYHTQAVLVAAEALCHDPSTGPDDSLLRWKQDHLKHAPIQAGKDLLAAVQSRLDLLSVERSLYLYRYFCGKLREGIREGRIARMILDLENRLVLDEEILPVGLRFLARRSASTIEQPGTPR